MVQDTEQSADRRSPGALLRAAREQAGLSIEQVAEKLHLLQSVVSSLEKDCYDRIRGETFVKGYMRNYARLLGISDEEVVSCYDANRSGAAKGESRAPRRRDPGPHGSSGTGRLSVVLALLGLSALFFVGNRDGATPQRPAASEHTLLTVETGRGAHVVSLLDDQATPGADASR